MPSLPGCFTSLQYQDSPHPTSCLFSLFVHCSSFLISFISFSCPLFHIPVFLCLLALHLVVVPQNSAGLWLPTPCYCFCFVSIYYLFYFRSFFLLPVWSYRCFPFAPSCAPGSNFFSHRTSCFKVALMTTLHRASFHVNEPYWLAPCNWELVTTHTLLYINRILGFLAFFLDSWPLKMGQIGCPKISVSNYHYSPCNNPEDHSSRSRLFFNTIF